MDEIDNDTGRMDYAQKYIEEIDEIQETDQQALSIEFALLT